MLCPKSAILNIHPLNNWFKYVCELWSNEITKITWHKLNFGYFILPFEFAGIFTIKYRMYKFGPMESMQQIISCCYDPSLSLTAKLVQGQTESKVTDRSYLTLWNVGASLLSGDVKIYNTVYNCPTLFLFGARHLLYTRQKRNVLLVRYYIINITSTDM